MTLVDLVLRGAALFNEGRFAQAVELLDEGVHWYPRLARLEEGDGPLIGRDAVQRAWQAQFDMFGGVGRFRLEVLRTEELGGGVVLVEHRVAGVGNASGLEVSEEFVTVWTFRGGTPVRIDSYATRDEALAALEPR